MTPNQKAFLDMIAVSEIGRKMLDMTDNGYNVIVGSTPDQLVLFPVLQGGAPDYSDHPRRFNAVLHSTAAGRYQQLSHNYDVYKMRLSLPDFSPASQDAIALQQIKECRAFDDIEDGNFEDAVGKCAHIWASLPGAGYGQHENKMAALQEAYEAAGGTVA